MNRLLYGAEAKGPVMSRDNSVHGASGGGIAPIGAVSCSLTASDDLQGPQETTTSIVESNFLDITLKLQGKTINTTLYYKVDAFNFNVIRLPEFSSNVHSSVGYNTFYSQLIRTGRICSNKTEFELVTCTLCLAFLNKGYNNKKLLIIAKKFAKIYKAIVLKLGYQTNCQIMLLFNTLFA